ncbi:MAG TPA: hypothetical protein PK916_15255 [Bacteroidota bacterium]|nr:hypothetical protein [Bacteroidota bacterium]
MRTRRAFIIATMLFTTLITACSEDDPVTPQEDHFEAIGMALYRGDTKVLGILRGVTTDTLRATVGVTGEDYDVRFYNENEQIVEADDDHESLGWEIADPSIVDVVQDAGKEGKFEFRLRGKKAGTTTVEFLIVHEGHADFRSGKIPVVVR